MELRGGAQQETQIAPGQGRRIRRARRQGGAQAHVGRRRGRERLGHLVEHESAIHRQCGVMLHRPAQGAGLRGLGALRGSLRVGARSLGATGCGAFAGPRRGGATRRLGRDPQDVVVEILQRLRTPIGGRGLRPAHRRVAPRTVHPQFDRPRGVGGCGGRRRRPRPRIRPEGTPRARGQRLCFAVEQGRQRPDREERQRDDELEDILEAHGGRRSSPARSPRRPSGVGNPRGPGRRVDQPFDDSRRKVPVPAIADLISVSAWILRRW